MFAFFGMESALQVSGEVRDAARAVPRAIALGVTGVGVLYIAGPARRTGHSRQRPRRSRDGQGPARRGGRANSPAGPAPR